MDQKIAEKSIHKNKEHAYIQIDISVKCERRLKIKIRWYENRNTESQIIRRGNDNWV